MKKICFPNFISDREFQPTVIIVIALDEIHSSAVLSLLVSFFVKSQLELVRVWRETSRHHTAQTAPQQARFGSD